MIRRKIVEIDETKCDGCGVCVPSCHEGALRIVNGKARLVSDVYCDGLGACLGECPRGAISIVERKSLPFDEAAVAERLSGASQQPTRTPQPVAKTHGCPGTQAMQMFNASRVRNDNSADSTAEQPSRLANWPVQLHLVPPQAPYLQNADLLLVADCVPFAYADFHRGFLDGRPVLIGCPKLDDGQFYVKKLTDLVRLCGIRRITVLHMEVPCCTGLVQIARLAIQNSGRAIPLAETTISLRGQILSSSEMVEPASPPRRTSLPLA